MEAKKTKEADLRNKTSFFFSIGLLVSLCLTLVAFEWKHYEKSTVDLIAKNYNSTEELLEVPPTVIPPPPKPVVVLPKIVEVVTEKDIKKDLTYDFDVDITQQKVFAPIKVFSDLPEEPVDDIPVVVEKSAEFPGGLKAFYAYCGKKIKYPTRARKLGVEGKVILGFVIGLDGSLTDITILSGLGAGLDEEAIRVLKESPRWKPARQGARIVRQRMSIPIIFRLD